ncbi:helix-turn-helix transcriptional regulator, partial [Micromonospora sp. CPCC 206061]|uniref:helix-turn-helix transcriptional regulator n=1 Tax=Micromonospora sp. CPCC 206061 TaxID=3122410 RepID=UPI002FEF8F7E
MSSDTPGRLLTLLSLLQAPREWPGSELAARLGVSLRTVRRDVDRLRELGYPVHAAMGATGGYRLVAGEAMPPLLLDDEEAVAIAVGLRAAAGHAVAGIEEASVRALAKIEQVLPAKLRHRVAALGAATEPLLTWDRPAVDPERLTTLAAAITNRERLRFTYRRRPDRGTNVTDPEALSQMDIPATRPAWKSTRHEKVTLMKLFPTPSSAVRRHASVIGSESLLVS